MINIKDVKYIFAAILLNYSISYSQGNVLKGRVTDSLSGEPISGAAVFISSKHLAYTNSEGFYSIDNLEEGMYNIEVVQIGYESLHGRINIPGDSLINFSLLPAPIEMGEIIVSTSRIDKDLRSTPYSALLVSTKEIQNLNFQSLPEALKNEPGISLISEGVWGTELSIRGLNRENVVALIDGNRIATSTDVAARFSLVDINDIERVEIIKGASSALYGSGATGGIVNIITKSPSFSNTFSIKGNISSGYNSVNNSSITSGSLYGSGPIWGAKITGSYRKAEDVKTPIGELKNSQFEDYSISGNLNISPYQNHLLKFNYQLFKADDVGIPGSAVFPNNADVRYPHEKRELISAGYEIKDISSILYKLSLKYSFQFIERDVENIPHTVQNVPASPTVPARRISVLKITPQADHKNNNFQLYGNMLLSKTNNLVLGVDYWDRSYRGERRRYQLIEILDSLGNVAVSTDRIIGEKPLPDSKFQSIGIFAQDDAAILQDKLLLTLGARIDKIYVKGDSAFNPIYEIVNGVLNNSPAGQKTIWNNIEDNDYSYSSNIGIKYAAIKNLDFTVSLGYSFRSPSLEERFQYIDQGSVLRIGNPNLNSEIGKSIDFGIRYYSQNLKIISSFFFNYFDNLVAEVPGTFENRNAFIKTNIGKSKMYGFDLNADYKFYRDFVLYTILSYVKGDDVTADGNLPEIPPLNGRVGIKFNLLNQIDTELSTSIFAEQNHTALGEIKTPGYAIFNLMLNTSTFNLTSLNLKVSAGIENIFDKNYRNHLSTTRGSNTVEPGRNFYIKLIANW